MPGAIARTIGQRTAPRAWCARRLEIEVNTMVAIEVAMAIFTASAGSTPRRDSMKVTKGTIIMPPPTPSRPARKPTTPPSSSNSAASSGSNQEIKVGPTQARSRASTARH